MRVRHQILISLSACSLLATCLPSHGAAPALHEGHPLADSLLGRMKQVDARVLNSDGKTARLELLGSAVIRSWTPLLLVAPPTSGADRMRLLGTGDVVGVNDGRRLDVQLQPGTVEPGLSEGAAVRVYLERHVVAVALDPDAEFSGTAGAALLKDLAGTIDRSLLDIRPFPSLADTSEALMEARRSGADLFGWLGVHRAGGEFLVELQLVSAKNASPAPPLRLRLRSSELPGSEPWPEDPAATLPGCRPVGTFSSPGEPALDAIPRRFRRDVVDVVHADRMESWRLTGDRAEMIRKRPFGPIWPPQAATRWPVATMLPLNSFFAPDRSEARVTYTLCSNQRARTLLITAFKSDPDSLDIAVSDGPGDTLRACTAGCFDRVDRVDPVSGYRRPEGLPPTASVQIALGRVDQGPSGLPAFDANGFVKTRKSAVIYYDPPSATLWLSSADTAFQVPGRFGDEIETYRVGRAGAPGFLVTSAAAAGEPDRLEFWVWDRARLTRRWQSAPFPGSIVAIYAGDLDGDAREDVWLACRTGSGAAAGTTFHYYRAAGGGS